MFTEFTGKNRVKEPFLKYGNSVFKLFMWTWRRPEILCRGLHSISRGFLQQLIVLRWSINFSRAWW